ncbi:AAA family ATPase [Nocardioides sp. LS1]|uniref:ATP-binding protein n=1 Tax=Nocardioides sp. LS1 TaxID=1027620 RepID=UPI000F61855F|nr:AAA family ATPase [Nocardioides sp. LS1]GCD89926.1 hypothetical protein NLS1_19320 [Nocardioides sp. LS1]
MGALPRPAIPPGAQRDLNDALHDLHHRSGWPSLRVLAREAGCSHTTVSGVFSAPRLPAWGVLEVLVEAMHGEVGQFHSLWLAASTPTEASSPAQPRIAGRRRELAVVRKHLESGSGLLLVAGEAGLGKTRLVGTAATLEAGDVFVARGSCLPLSTEVPFLPIADTLRAVHALDEGQWLKEALAECAAFVPGALRALLPELDATGTDPEPQGDWSRQRLFTAVEATLAALAGSRPLAVLIEDLHWADSGTLDLLEHLLARGARWPLLGTWRLDDPATATATLDWFTVVRRLPDADVLELAPLSRDETGEQLELLLSHPADPDLVDRVYQRTLGQPLFTDQLSATPEGSGDLPRLLVDLLDRRLEGLADGAWAVAGALGVADRALTDSQLADVTPLPPAGLASGLRDLAARRLLTEPSRPREVELRHPLLAEAIRRRLVAGEAAEQHRRLAEALAAGPDPSPAEIATHWQAADDPAQELVWRIRAARAAEDRFAMAGAAEQWLRVLELWPPDAAPAGSPPISRWTAYAATADALEGSSQIGRSVDLLEGALAWASDLSPDETADLYGRVGGYRTFFQQPAAGLPLLDRSIALYEQLPPFAGYPRALNERATAQINLGRSAEAVADLARAVEVSLALDDPAAQRRYRVAQARHDYYLTGDRMDAVARISALTALVLARPDPVGDIEAALAHTDMLLQEGADADTVEEAARRGLEAAATWGIEDFLTSMLLVNVSEAFLREGRVTRAAALIDPVTDDTSGNDRYPLRLQRARLDALRGEPGAVSRLGALDEMVPTIRSWFVPWAADVELWCGRPRQALDQLLADLEWRATASVPAPGSDTFMLMARAAADIVALTGPTARRRQRAELVDRLHRARAAADALPLDHYCNRDVATSAVDATYAAELARLTGEQTVELWVAAASAWDGIHRPHEAAYARWRAAQVALAGGQASTAATLLRKAGRQAREHVPLLSAIAATR